MRATIISLLLTLVPGWLLPVYAENRIMGAEMVKPGKQMGELMPELLQFEVNKSELDLFVAQVGLMEKWAAQNPEQWLRVGSTEDPITEIMSWKDWWSSAEITAADTIAMMIKLNAARQITMEAFKQMPTSIKIYKARIADPKVPEKDKVSIRRTLAHLQQIVDGVNAYPVSNKRFYKENETAIEEALARFDEIHATAGEKAAGKKSQEVPAEGAKEAPAKAPEKAPAEGSKKVK